MYTIYIENIPVFIGKNSPENQFNDFQNVKSLFFNELPNMGKLKVILEEIKQGSVRFLHLISNNAAADFEVFCKEFKLIVAAGGLVQNSEGKYLLIERLGWWDLPKGKVEPNEAVSLAAVREVEEECGIPKPEIISELPCTWHVYVLKNKWILKQSVWYAMKSDFKGKLIPQTEEDITACEWKSKDEVKLLLPKMYPSIAHLLEQVLFEKSI
jgi:8-oxo-dGTP pyrophosphatase MutT (NUDIX family)